MQDIREMYLGELSEMCLGIKALAFVKPCQIAN